MSVILCGVFTLVGCEPHVAGGGRRQIQNILILSQSNKPLLKENNTTTVTVGQDLPLRVVAAWATPDIGDVTPNVIFFLNCRFS